MTVLFSVECAIAATCDACHRTELCYAITSLAVARRRTMCVPCLFLAAEFGARLGEVLRSTFTGESTEATKQ